MSSSQDPVRGKGQESLTHPRLTVHEYSPLLVQLRLDERDAGQEMDKDIFVCRIIQLNLVLDERLRAIVSIFSTS